MAGEVMLLNPVNTSPENTSTWCSSPGVEANGENHSALPGDGEEEGSPGLHHQNHFDLLRYRRKPTSAPSPDTGRSPHHLADRSVSDISPLRSRPETPGEGLEGFRRMKYVPQPVSLPPDYNSLATSPTSPNARSASVEAGAPGNEPNDAFFLEVSTKLSLESAHLAMLHSETTRRREGSAPSTASLRGQHIAPSALRSSSAQQRSASPSGRPIQADAKRTISPRGRPIGIIGGSPAALDARPPRETGPDDDASRRIHSRRGSSSSPGGDADGDMYSSLPGGLLQKPGGVFRRGSSSSPGGDVDNDMFSSLPTGILQKPGGAFHRARGSEGAAPSRKLSPSTRGVSLQWEMEAVSAAPRGYNTAPSSMPPTPPALPPLVDSDDKKFGCPPKPPPLRSGWIDPHTPTDLSVASPSPARRLAHPSPREG